MTGLHPLFFIVYCLILVAVTKAIRDGAHSSSAIAVGAFIAVVANSFLTWSYIGGFGVVKGALEAFYGSSSIVTFICWAVMAIVTLLVLNIVMYLTMGRRF